MNKKKDKVDNPPKFNSYSDEVHYFKSLSEEDRKRYLDKHSEFAYYYSGSGNLTPRVFY